MDEPPMLAIEGIRKSVNIPSGESFFFIPRWKKTEILKGIGFNVQRGEFAGLVGPNGAGKSTLIKILSGIVTPDSGSATVAGHTPWQRKNAFFKEIGVLFGNRSNLIFDVPVIDSLLLLKDVYGIPDAAFEERLALLTKLLELKPLLKTPVRKLSFGQRMRAEIASVFLHSPKIVFLDEPTIALDALGKEQVYAFLKEINEKENVTIVLTTHNLAEVELLCKRMVLLNEGKKIWEGKISDFRKQFVQHKDVRITMLDEVYPTEVLEKYGLARTGSEASGRVANAKVISAVEELMRRCRLASIIVEEPDLEEIIREFYRAMKHG